jgi:hypothetical protein
MNKHPIWSYAAMLLQALAAVVAAWFSFDFGLRAGGPGAGVALGALAALNGGVMAALLAASALDRLQPRRRV